MEAAVADQPAHPLDGVAHAEERQDPRPQIAERPASVLAGIRVGAGIEPRAQRRHLSVIQQGRAARTCRTGKHGQAPLIVAVYPVTQGLGPDPRPAGDFGPGQPSVTPSVCGRCAR